MGKIKGTRAERELIHLFYSTGKFMPCRIAGSGSAPLPSPDLIVGGMNRIFAIECKCTKSTNKHFHKKEIDDLNLFSKLFGAVPIVGIKFDYKGWYFIGTKKLKKSKTGNFNITLKQLNSEGLKFEDLIKGM